LETINPPLDPSERMSKDLDQPRVGHTESGALGTVPEVRCRKRRIRKMADRSSPPAKAIHIPYKP